MIGKVPMRKIDLIPWFIAAIAFGSSVIKSKTIYNRDQSVTHYKERFDHAVRMRELALARSNKYEKALYECRETK